MLWKVLKISEKPLFQFYLQCLSKQTSPLYHLVNPSLPLFGDQLITSVSGTSLSSSSSVIWAGIKHGGFQHVEGQMLKSFLSSTNSSLHHHHSWSLWTYLGNEVHCKNSELCPHFRARKQANALSYLCIHRGRCTWCWCAAHGTEVSLGRLWCWLLTSVTH